MSTKPIITILNRKIVDSQDIYLILKSTLRTECCGLSVEEADAEMFAGFARLDAMREAAA